MQKKHRLPVTVFIITAVMALRPHVKVSVSGRPLSARQMHILSRCSIFAARWQHLARIVKAHVISLQSSKHWRTTQELYRVFDALRAVQATSQAAQACLAQVLHQYQFQLNGMHQYNAHIAMQKPHYFFTNAYDPLYHSRPKVPDLSAVLFGRAVRSEVTHLRQLLILAQDLLRQAGAFTAGQGHLIPNQLVTSRLLCDALRSLGRWYMCASAKTIQQHWRKAIVDPSYAVCRSRLMAEFHYLKDHMTFALPCGAR